MIQILKRRFVKAITKFYDPMVDLQIGNQVIKTPLSHQLRLNIKAFPDYNFNLPRLIKYASKFLSNITIIDIGANIGDTVAFIKNYSNAPILCIDGEEKYLAILKQNTVQYDNVSVCHALVGKENKEVNVSMKMERGTAYVAEAKNTTRVRTLENILEEFPAFENSKILKVDTDGYDTLILRGCTDFLKKVKPVIFFEFDPFLISKNGDDPFQFIDYLRICGYEHLIFYVNNGDYLLSCNINEKDTVNQLIHYFSGRNIAMFTDICAFFPEDKAIFEFAVQEEIKYFQKARKY